MTDTLEDRAPMSEPMTLPDDFMENLFMTERGDAAATAPICAEVGCTNEVVKTSNKGPWPKYCPDHKGARDTTRGTGPTTRTKRSAAKWKGAAQVEANLNKAFEFLVLPTMALPQQSPLYADALLTVHYMPLITHELIILADDDPRLQRTLLRLSTPGKYGALAGAVGGLLLGIAANHGMLPGILNQIIASQNAQVVGGDK